MPVRDPTRIKMIIAEDVDLIFLLISFRILLNPIPWKEPIIIVINAENNKALWLGKLISWKKDSWLAAINPININNGTRANSNDIFFLIWYVFFSYDFLSSS